MWLPDALLGWGGPQFQESGQQQEEPRGLCPHESLYYKGVCAGLNLAGARSLLRLTDAGLTDGRSVGLQSASACVT